MEIPNNWNEVLVDDFLEIKSLEENEHNSFFQNQISLLSILCAVDEEEFEEMEVDELNNIIKGIKWIKSQPSNEFANKIGDYHFKPLDKLTFGEFLDIQHFMADDYYKNLKILAVILFRKQKVDEWGHIVWEPYNGIDIWKRANEFSEIPITAIFGLIQHILKWKEEFMKIYANIFQPIIEDADPDEELSAEDLIDEAKEKELERFSWQFLIQDITNDDLTKYDAVTDLPLIQVFNYLTAKKIKPQ